MGFYGKSKKAEEENNKQTATEILNLKITNVQMSKYAEEQRMPTLKELAYFLDPERDKDIKSVTKTSQKVSSLDWINDNDYSSIFTTLKDYPEYEFEIDKDLKLAKINGVKIADNTTSNNEKLDALAQTMEQKNKELNDKIAALEKKLEENKGIEYTTTPATTVSSATLEKPCVVIENYSNGSSWYRVWSDGWIEQGGKSTGGASQAGAAINLHKSFSSVNYTITTTIVAPGKDTNAWTVDITKKETTRFYASSAYTGSGSRGCHAWPLDWYACGY